MRGEYKAMKYKNLNEKVEIEIISIYTTRKEPKLAFGEQLKNYKIILMEEEREYRRYKVKIVTIIKMLERLIQQSLFLKIL